METRKPYVLLPWLLHLPCCEALWGHGVMLFHFHLHVVSHTASAYLGSVQPLQLLLLGLSPSCLLYTPCQLGTQLLLCVGSGLERVRELLSQVQADGG